MAGDRVIWALSGFLTLEASLNKVSLLLFNALELLVHCDLHILAGHYEEKRKMILIIL